MAKNGKRLGFLPGWRIFSYVIVIVNLIFLISIISALASTSGHATDCGTLDQQTCDDARNVGAGIGTAIIFVFWAVVDVILGVLWMITKPRGQRDCPVCGHNVKKGVTVCRNCNHDFRIGVPPHHPTPA